MSDYTAAAAAPVVPPPDLDVYVVGDGRSSASVNAAAESRAFDW